MTAVARGGAGGRERQLTRRGLVVVQIALALTLLVGSGLALRSFHRLASVDPGFDPLDVLAFGISLPHRDYETHASRLNFYRQVVDRLRALPGAVAAAAAGAVPLEGVVYSAGYSIEGRPRREGDEWPVFAVKSVSPSYFDAMRIPLVEGRVFDRLDEERDAPVVIVSLSLARAYWPGESALGKQIRMGNPPNEGEGERWSRIVGVVDHVHEIALHEDPPEMVYSPVLSRGTVVADAPWPFRYILRAPNTAALGATVREAVRGLDPTLPVYGVDTLKTWSDGHEGSRRSSWSCSSSLPDSHCCSARSVCTASCRTSSGNGAARLPSAWPWGHRRVTCAGWCSPKRACSLWPVQDSGSAPPWC